MNRINSTGVTSLPRTGIAALAVAIVLGMTGAAHATRVLIAGDVFPSSGPTQKAVYSFDLSGALVDVFGETTVGSYFSITAHNDTVYVGVTGHGIKQFSFDGDFLGPTPHAAYIDTPRIETDAAGNLYYTSWTGFHRINPDGSPSNVFPTTGTQYAIDADGDGNVYNVANDTSHNRALRKYDAAGSFLGAVSVPGTSDIAIDEAAGILYLATGGGKVASSIQTYDISGSLPALTGSIPAPGTIGGLSFDSVTGHLFTTSLFAGRGYELATDGTVLQRFDMGIDAFALAAFDIVAIPAPEPASGLLAACAIVAATRMRK